MWLRLWRPFERRPGRARAEDHRLATAMQRHAVRHGTSMSPARCSMPKGLDTVGPLVASATMMSGAVSGHGWVQLCSAELLRARWMRTRSRAMSHQLRRRAPPRTAATALAAGLVSHVIACWQHPRAANRGPLTTNTSNGRVVCTRTSHLNERVDDKSSTAAACAQEKGIVLAIAQWCR